MTWWDERMVAFDLETTSPLPEEARIVTAAIAFCGGGQPTETRTWLADPGVEIPEGAAAIHGITTEKARAEGRPAEEVVNEVATALASRPLGSALVIFNARYDLTVMDRELRRRLGIPLPEGIAQRVVDPFVIDKHLDRYRKGLRQLEPMAEHYMAELSGAHDATFDAIAAARVAWCIGRRGMVIRRVRSASEGVEKAALVREWDAVRGDLDELHAAQERWALAERIRFAEYKRSVGDLEDAERIALEKGWPVLEPMAHEEAAA